MDPQVSFLDLAHLSLFARPIIMKIIPIAAKLMKAGLSVDIKATPNAMKQIPKTKNA